MPQCLWKNCNINVAENELRNHLLEHVNLMTDPYKCMWSDCIRFDKKLSSKYTLISHIKTHCSVKPLECLHCDKLFTREPALKKHMLKHQQEVSKRATECSNHWQQLLTRDALLTQTEDLLNERQYYLNLARLLKDEIVRDKTSDDDWNKYL
ncbi:hypothetical protein NUSPORA_01018 [Nucleospora cyclopteri]